MAPLVATFAALLLAGTSAPVSAQATKPAKTRMPEHEGATTGMAAMMASPHHRLAMAYRDNLATFARVLQKQVQQSRTVDVSLARPAVTEMRRSFEQMREHQQAHMTTMADHPDTPMSGMMKQMEERRASLNDHLIALESAVNASAPDRQAVSEHTAEVLKHCVAMSPMAAKAKPHPAK